MLISPGGVCAASPIGSSTGGVEALQTATLLPARYLDRPDLGRVKKGFLADLVLLDANPLDDIANTRRIRAVVANGRFYSRDDLDALLEDVEKRASQP